jgi:hypothetical protein
MSIGNKYDMSGGFFKFFFGGWGVVKVLTGVLVQIYTIHN